MRYTYKTQGTCSTEISFDINGNVVTNIVFKGGCNGNLKGIAAIADGMTVEQITEKLSGLTCGFKRTSCPDQLAKAVNKAFSEQ